jgi:hypothetical protein
MHLATKILFVRFTQRFSAQIFRGTSFFGTFPARNMKASWLDPNIMIYANEGAGTSGTI